MNMRDRISLMTAALALVGLGAATATANECGGFGASRVACDCGDVLVRSTDLSKGDPVVQNVCPDDGLIIGADNITLDCRNRTLRGDGVVDDSFTGVLLTERRKVTIKRCRITAFDYGIRLADSSWNIIVKNNLFDNEMDGIRLSDNSDHNFLGWNRTNDNGQDGIDLDDDSDRNTLTANVASRNNAGGAGSAIEDCRECDGNTYIANTTNQTFLGNGLDDDGLGLWVTGADSEVRGNRGRRNARSGLIVEGTGARVAKNHFDRNGTSGQGDGICVVSGNFNLGGNRGRRNADAQVAFNQDSCPTVEPIGVEIPTAAVAAAPAGSADADD